MDAPPRSVIGCVTQRRISMIGEALSHFKITEKLGEGGMGEVYRAQDSKLGREVAIKVLPEAVAGDSERLARFEREAKLLASLNHPAIGAIHGAEVSGRDPARSLRGELLAQTLDGERVVMAAPDETCGVATEVKIALNWLDELRELAPASGG